MTPAQAQYLAELKQLLASLDEGERNDAVAYYEEYLADANLTTQAAIAAHLGSPKQLSKQIIAQIMVDKVQSTPKENQSPKTLMKLIKVVIIALLAVPAGIFVALPLAAGVMMAAVGIVGFLLLVVGLLFGGLVSAVGSLMIGGSMISTTPVVGWFYLGCGLAGLGVVLLVVPLLGKVCWLILRLLGKAGVAGLQWAKRHSKKHRGVKS